MDCPYCGCPIPAECRNDWDYACPTCREAFRVDPKLPHGQRVVRSGPRCGPRREPAAVRVVPEGTTFREWFDALTS